MEEKEDNNESGSEKLKSPDFMTTKKKFTIFLSNDNTSEYTLSLELNKEQIMILLKNNDDIFFKCQKEYTLEEIKQLSNIFVFYPKLSDIYNYFVEMLENKSLVLKQNLNDIYLSFTFNNPYKKENEEVKLYLEKKKLNKEEERESMMAEIHKLKKEVKELKKENKNLKIMEKKNKGNIIDIPEKVEEIEDEKINQRRKENIKEDNEKVEGKNKCACNLQ